MILARELQNLVDKGDLTTEQAEYLNKILGNFVTEAFWYIENTNPKYQLDITDFWYISKYALWTLVNPKTMNLIRNERFPLKVIDLLDITESGYNTLLNQYAESLILSGKINDITGLNDYVAHYAHEKVEIEYDCPIPDRFICPITGDIIESPVYDPAQVGSEVPRFEQQALLKCLQTNLYNSRTPENPLTRESYHNRSIKPDAKLKAEIDQFKREHQVKSITIRYK